MSRYLNITVLQMDLAWEDKEANLAAVEKRIRALDSSAEVVVLPEMFSTGFSMNPALLAETMNGTTVNWMKQISAERKIVLTGSLIIEENGHYYNRLLWVLPDGQVGMYDKKHRFAYAGEDKY